MATLVTTTTSVLVWLAAVGTAQAQDPFECDARYQPCGAPEQSGGGGGGGGGSDANLPASPTRQDVARALGPLTSRIRQCAGDQVGLAISTIVVNSDGSVATVSVGGSPFGGTPQGACMEGVIRGARFPRFRNNTFRVSYPFNIR